MAKKITVTWTDSTGNTVAPTHHIVQRKEGVGGTYAQLGSNIVNGTETYSDESTLVDSTQYYYRVGAVFASGNTLWIESNITISAPTATTYGLDLTVDNLGTVRIPHTLTTENFKLDMTPIDNAMSAAAFLVHTNTLSSTNGYMVISTNSSQCSLTIYDVSSKSTALHTYTLGQSIAIERTSLTNINLLINDVVVESITCDASFDVAGAFLNIGSRNTVVNFCGCKLSALGFKVGAGAREEFLPTAQTSGTPLVGDNATNCTIYATDVDACYFAI